MSMVSTAASLGAAAVAGHWVGNRRDSLGRPRSFPVWSLSLLAVLALGAAVPGIRKAREEKRLTEVATTLVGHQVAVHCQGLGGALVDAGAELGFVPYDANGVPEAHTIIKRDPCHDLQEYLSGGRGHPSADEVVAVHVLTHESMHMRGQTSEALAECEAVQRDERTASLLGATDRQARLLAVTYWLTVYPNMPDDYRTADCVPGGKADEGLPTAPWLKP